MEGCGLLVAAFPSHFFTHDADQGGRHSTLPYANSTLLETEMRLATHRLLGTQRLQANATHKRYRQTLLRTYALPFTHCRNIRQQPHFSWATLGRTRISLSTEKRFNECLQRTNKGLRNPKQHSCRPTRPTRAQPTCTTRYAKDAP
jgi:hypothetical protein